MKRFVEFVKDVKAEATKVVWPDKKTTIRMTVYVIVMSLIFAVVLGGADYLLNELVKDIVS